MNNSKFIDRAKLIYRRANVALDDQRAPASRANQLLRLLIDLKQDLDDVYEWSYDLEMLDFLDDEWDDPEPDEIDGLIEDVRDQASNILERMGVDPDEDSARSANSGQTTNIHFSPHMIQNMSASISAEASVEISRLLNEAERELSTGRPDRNKIQQIKDALVPYGPQAVGQLTDLLTRFMP